MISENQKKRLEQYYEMWLKGCTQDEIRDTLGMSEADFDRQTYMFFNYCRAQLGKETNMALAQHEKPDLLKLTELRRQRFLDLVSSGLTYPKAAKFMGIPLVTITNVWFKDDPVLKREAEYAAELLDANVVIALKKRAIGYKETNSSKTKATGEKVLENGTVVPYLVTDSVTETTSNVRPDVTAQKLWLINRKPDEWSPDGERNRGSNKGKILEKVESEIAEGTPEEDAMFDEENANYESLTRDEERDA